jgi:hypothetical protein
VFIILKQGIDTIKIESEENVIGMETDEDCVSQECEPEVSHILS